MTDKLPFFTVAMIALITIVGVVNIGLTSSRADPDTIERLEYLEDAVMIHYGGHGKPDNCDLCGYVYANITASNPVPSLNSTGGHKETIRNIKEE